MPFLAVDSTDRIVYCNQAVSDLTGFTWDELRQRKLLTDLVPAKWHELINTAFKACEPGCYPEKLCLEICRKSGGCAPVEVCLNVIGNDGGKPLFYLMFLFDLTGHKLAEAASCKRESGVARALRIAGIGTWELNAKTLAITCSDEAYRILDARLDSGKVQDYKDLAKYVCPEDFSEVKRAVRDSIRGNGKLEISFRIIRKDGSVRIVSVEGELIPGAGGNEARMFGTVQDITERKRAEDELKAAKAQAELYVDLMGHDINNMNQIAMGYLELAEGIIEARGSLSRDDRFLITRPIETLRDNSRLIDNVRKIQKSKAGVYKSEEVEIGSVLRTVIARFSDVSGRDVRIRLDPACSCTVMANELLNEVFLNLIGNAIKHSTGPLSVNITAEKFCEDGGVMCRVAVEDNGPGIPDDLKKKLFDRLSLEKTRASGKGFGLCLTKMLVDDFNGQFWVEDRVKGDHSQGCRFVVLLPAIEKCGK